MNSVLRIAAVASIAVAAPAQADQVRFTGETTVDQTLIRDALQTILQFAHATQDCSSLEKVESMILSPGYTPSDAMSRPEGGRGTYEAWTATLCGTQSKFLMTFWPAEQGGTMFGVGYPYPADAP